MRKPRPSGLRVCSIPQYLARLGGLGCMSTFSQVYDLHNLRRAYRWVLSSTDARYKNYFRQGYAAYALATALNLRLLSRQIRGGRFTPSYASKVYLPKASGVLRPVSLLTVNDQIAYQACVNIVAEELQKRTRKRRHVTVFYHLYAGKRSQFFYLRWEASYRAYANAIRANFANGFRYVATFDLTAFYDSIDHHVLKVFLLRSGVDPDTTEFLLSNLKHWTESTWSGGRGRPIFHEHGIPQGPLTSGVLSEVVLQHLDAIGDRRSKDARYLRYVDDIKIMAKDEKTLRRRLIALDVASKEIGLFPQGSKIAIREISDPEEEIKSVSVPPEPAVASSATQDDIRIRVKALANRGRPTDSTRFRYVLPRLEPSNKTNGLLYKTLINQPELSEAITRHFEKYKKLPKSLADRIIAEVLAEGVYHSVNADLLNLLRRRIDGARMTQVADFAYERLFAGKFRGAGFAVPQPTYRVALIRWAILSTRMTFADVEGLVRGERDWWVRQELLSCFDEKRFGRPSFELLLNLGMKAADPDPARVAASLVFENSLSAHRPHQDNHWAARILLRNVGLIPYAGRPPSLIPVILGYVMQFTTPYNWQRLFGGAHDAAERFAILSKQRFETDIDAFVVSLDSFCDLILRQIFQHRGHTMNTAYGNALKTGAPAWLRADFPSLMQGFGRLRELRIRSFTAHPRHQKTGALNRRITHTQYHRVRRLLVSSFEELTRALPL
jgi:Reverse transcriptase (RNA-dependent DNA polymerase)